MPDPFILCSLSFIVGLIALWAIPERSCPRCAHCRQLEWEKKDQKRRQAQAAQDTRRALHIAWHNREGSDNCPYCEEDNPQ